MSKEIIIEALISASKWGSWAYDLKERDRQGKTKLEDFKEWRKEVMEDIYNDYINQNKPLPPPPPKDREIHISGKSRHKR